MTRLPSNYVLCTMYDQYWQPGSWQVKYPGGKVPCQSLGKQVDTGFAQLDTSLLGKSVPKLEYDEYQ